MARIRSIKPEFWTDEKIVELSAFARLLFIGLWNFVDDEGRMIYSEKRSKMQILPGDSLDISELFGEIRGKKLVEVYVVDNVEYLQVVNFANHQKIDKRQRSKLPPNPDSPAESPRISPPDQGMDQGKEKSYRFAASVIKLSEKDYLDLKKNNHAIPDFDAELRAANLQYEKEPPGNWFCALGNRLNSKHQHFLAKQPSVKQPEKRAGARQA